MKIYFKRIAFVTVATIFLVAPLFVLAQSSDNACGFGGLFVIRDSNGKEIGKLIDGMPIICTAQQLIAWVIQLALAFAGIVTTLFIILGGYWYLTAGGNDEQAEKARKTLTNSVIGLVVILMAAVIVRIVINTLDSTTIGSGGTYTQNGGTPSPTGSASSGGPLIIDGVSKLPNPPLDGGFEAGSTISLSYNFVASNEAEAEAMRKKIASEYCNGNFTGATFDLFIGDKKVASSRLTEVGTTIRTQESEVKGVLPKEPGTVAVYAGICGNKMDGSGGDVTVVQGMDVQPSSAKIDAAAKELDFGFRKLNDTTLRITISGRQSDKMTVCSVDSVSNIGQGTLELFIDGQSAKKASADASYIDWDYGEPLDQFQSFTVLVEMCGHSIGGGHKEYTPGPRG